MKIGWAVDLWDLNLYRDVRSELIQVLSQSSSKERSTYVVYCTAEGNWSERLREERVFFILVWLRCAINSIHPEKKLLRDSC
jgi:hypothetical protein